MTNKLKNSAKRIYIAGPMRGIPYFNFPLFFKAEENLHVLGHTTFNPARRDCDRHGKDISKDNPTGDLVLAGKQHGFSLRDALGDDMEYICRYADGIALLPGWENSKGAKAEKATAEALGLEILYLNENAELCSYNEQQKKAA